MFQGVVAYKYKRVVCAFILGRSVYRFVGNFSFSFLSSSSYFGDVVPPPGRPTPAGMSNMRSRVERVEGAPQKGKQQISSP